MSGLLGMRGTAVLLAAIGLIVLVVLLARAEIAWHRADSFRAKGNLQAAIRAAREVFDVYVPGNPRLEDASKLIWDVAEAKETAGDRAASLEVYRVLRSAWIGAHPLGGDGGWIERSEARIARLIAEVPVSPGESGASPQGGREAALLAAMRATARPYGVWGALAALGFAGWLCATVGFILRGFGRGGVLTGSGFRWVAGIAVSYLVWILGLLRA
jgi:hypothetical protein